MPTYDAAQLFKTDDANGRFDNPLSLRVMVMALRINATERPDLEWLLQQRPAWHAQALCRQYRDVSWFVERGQSTEPAKSICGRCPVKVECLAFAVETDADGVWAGTSAKQRRMLGKIVSNGAGQLH